MASSLIKYLYVTSKKKKTGIFQSDKKMVRFDLNDDILKQKDFFMIYVSYSASIELW